jgi:hypothetical protein
MVLPVPLVSIYTGGIGPELNRWSHPLIEKENPTLAGHFYNDIYFKCDIF